jgi:hypothetical protein
MLLGSCLSLLLELRTKILDLLLQAADVEVVALAGVARLSRLVACRVGRGRVAVEVHQEPSVPCGRPQGSRALHAF